MFEKLMNSNLLHKPLELNEQNSLETEILNEEEISDVQLIHGEWKHLGRGEMKQVGQVVCLKTPTRFETFPAHYPQDGDYTNFGEIKAALAIEQHDWTAFNQLKLRITTDCINVVNPAITIGLKNEGVISIPDTYDREGYHVINLKNKLTKEYVLNLNDLPRDQITELTFSIGANGSYMNLPGEWKITLEEVRLEKNQRADGTKGWHLDNGKLIYSHIGYANDSEKTATVSADYIGSQWKVSDAHTNEIVATGAVIEKKTTIGVFGNIEFSNIVTNGEYILEVGKLKSKRFLISEYRELLTESTFKALNFVFCERCGCPVEGVHGTCHADVYAEHEGKKIVFNGGWHDAGDLSQQLIQTAEVTLGLFKMAETFIETEPLLAQRFSEEAQWGLDFILKMRLGDGFRVTIDGVTRFTDNQIGNMDDAIARVHNSPYDNFLITGILADIVRTLPDNSFLNEKILSILELDYQDALSGFEQAPFQHEPIFWEHTYSTSKSLFLATLVWTSSLMYQVTNQEKYRTDCISWLNQLMDCQERTGIELFDGSQLRGMFYRDEQKQVFQHFNHQAREHLYAYAFQEATLIIEDTEIKEKLHQAIVFYGEYLTYLTQFTDPYPMIASGIYHIDEWQEEESFARQHLLVDEEAKEAYQVQLQQGEAIGEGYYIKRFPVWFSFRGNNAILLSMGESATVIGRLLEDDKLLAIGFNQMQWMIGKNPFSQSMMYGEGTNYPQMYSVSSGEMMGEMPVGMQTFENEDQPYWPHFNNATYKEVWVGLAGKWFTLAAQYMNRK